MRYQASRWENAGIDLKRLFAVIPRKGFVGSSLDWLLWGCLSLVINAIVTV